MTTSTTTRHQLYMFYVGGSAGRSNIEVHDVQFAAVARVEDAYPALRQAWFGDTDSLHLDGYTRVGWADGYDVSLGSTPCKSGLHLYFINMGGYSADCLAELHAFGLFVAPNEAAAKARARQILLQGAALRHKDDLREVDNCLALQELGGLHVHLRPNPHGSADRPEWQGYRPISVAKLARARAPA